MIAKIENELFSLQDIPYKEFQSTLIPTLPKDQIIGVRVPQLRAFAKKLCGRKDFDAFLRSLPHTYYEENMLHAFCIADITDFNACICETERFLPYIDNWATCDSFRPRCFARHKQELLPHIRRWIHSPHPYTVRFAMEMLMVHYLEESFSEEYPAMVAAVRSNEHYVNMMAAWYFATALAAQKEHILPYFAEKRLSPDVLPKAIRKALESYRIDAATKDLLRRTSK